MRSFLNKNKIPSYYNCVCKCYKNDNVMQNRYAYRNQLRNLDPLNFQKLAEKNPLRDELAFVHYF